MRKPDHARPSAPLMERAELVRLVRRIQALALEVQEPRRRGLDRADVEAKERLLEQGAGDWAPRECGVGDSAAMASSSCQTPTSFSSALPRERNSMQEPATRSRTVEDAST